MKQIQQKTYLAIVAITAIVILAGVYLSDYAGWFKGALIQTNKAEIERVVVLSDSFKVTFVQPAEPSEEDLRPITENPQEDLGLLPSVEENQDDDNSGTVEVPILDDTPTLLERPDQTIDDTPAAFLPGGNIEDIGTLPTQSGIEDNISDLGQPSSGDVTFPGGAAKIDNDQLSIGKNIQSPIIDTQLGVKDPTTETLETPMLESQTKAPNLLGGTVAPFPAQQALPNTSDKPLAALPGQDIVPSTNVFTSNYSFIKLTISDNDRFPLLNTFVSTFSKQELTASDFIGNILFSDIDKNLNLGLTAGKFDGIIYFRAVLLDADQKEIEGTNGEIKQVRFAGTPQIPEADLNFANVKAKISNIEKTENNLKISYSSEGNANFDKYGVAIFNDENFENDKEKTFKYLLECKDEISQCIRDFQNNLINPSYLGNPVLKQDGSQIISITEILKTLSKNNKDTKLKLVPYLIKDNQLIVNSFGKTKIVNLEAPAQIENLEWVDDSLGRYIQITFKENSRTDFENYGAMIILEKDIDLMNIMINAMEEAPVMERAAILEKLDTKKDFLITEQVKKGSDRILKVSLSDIFIAFSEIDQNYNGKIFVIPALAGAGTEEVNGLMVPDSDGLPKSIYHGVRSAIKNADVDLFENTRFLKVEFENVNRDDYNQFILTVFKPEDILKAEKLTEIIGEVNDVTLRTLLMEKAEKEGFKFYISDPIPTNTPILDLNLDSMILPELGLEPGYTGNLMLMAGLSKDNFYIDESNSEPQAVTLTLTGGGEVCSDTNPCTALAETCEESICTLTGCLEDTDCTEGQVCLEDYTCGTEISPLCTQDSDCQNGGTCTEINGEMICLTVIGDPGFSSAGGTDDNSGPGGGSNSGNEPKPSATYECSSDLLEDFPDCDEDDWWFEDFAYAVDNGDITGYELFPGMPDYQTKASRYGVQSGMLKLFYPEGTLTYEQLITMLVRAIDAEDKVNVAFPNASDWAQEYLKRAYKVGLLDENSLDFDFTTTVPRKEAVKMVLAAAGEDYRNVVVTSATFPDVTNLSSDDAKAIKKATDLGLVEGADDGKFYPDEILNRAEVVTIINRGYENKIF